MVVSVCRELSGRAEVTAAFRALVGEAGEGSFRCLALEPSHVPQAALRSDNAVRGLSPLALWRYVRALRRFAEERHGEFDCAVEYGWRGSGLLSESFRRWGVAGIPAEHFPRLPRLGGGMTPRQVVRRAALRTSEAFVMRMLRRAPVVTAESETLREDLAERVGLAAERVRVVPIGLDHALFFPRDQAACRRQLGMPVGGQVWTYVGGMGMYHDMRPCLRAFAEVRPPGVSLLLVGDGTDRESWLEAAGAALGSSVRFVGRVPYESVPLYIGAADLCLAPYVVERYPGGKITSATLKIPQYMACARAAVSVPSGEILRLIRDGENGFLFANTQEEWGRFFAHVPPAARLREMGERGVPVAATRSWTATAQAFLNVCREACARAAAT
jgi:glycosyltransferase involved in cell wall biosynthesis